MERDSLSKWDGGSVPVGTMMGDGRVFGGGSIAFADTAVHQRSCSPAEESFFNAQMQ